MIPTLADCSAALERELLPDDGCGSVRRIYTAETLPPAPPALHTDALVFEKGVEAWGAYSRSDVLHLHADRPALRQLGLLALRVLFHAAPARVELALDHPASQVRRLVLVSPLRPADECEPGLSERPHAFVYFPSQPDEHPWAARHLDPRDLPSFLLTSHDERIEGEAGWAARDTVIGFGLARGAALFAGLLLDAAQPWDRTSYALEGELGARGVAPGSAALRLWLPGSARYRGPSTGP